MKAFGKTVGKTVVFCLVMMLMCSFVYPLALTGVSQLTMKAKADGSKVDKDGNLTTDTKEAVGSALIGQDFTEDCYFQGRVSAVNYNTYTEEQKESGEYAGVASGSYNYANSNPELKERMEKDLEQFLKEHPGVKAEDVPAELLTASGSGLDPHISPESAEVQIPTVAKNSGLSEEEVKKIVEENTEKKTLGVFGEERVNVLGCNLDIAAAMGKQEVALTEENRPDPGLLLKKLQYEEKEKEKQTKGKLKIFLGYAAGSGKTYAMLEAAHEAKKHQVDVVAGYIEPHARPDTQAMAEGLEEIPPLMVDYKEIQLREFNLDAALERKPKLILVDELAHTNVRGSRNEKRYQDVRELLRAGINVYTTMNIQHLESLNDLVGNITNIEVKERVPDSVFDQADQVEVIDIEPEDLIERMKEGKIYDPVQAERALENFFRREKLVALREIALRRSADRVNRIAEEERNILGNTGYHTGEHILACISAAPSSAKVIRTAARLSYAFHAQFTALYVETPAMQEAGEKTKQTLKSHLELAKALGAKIVTVYGEDAAYQIAEYAIVSNVSKVVMGRTNHRGIWRRPRIEVMEKLTHMAPNIDVYIIPDIRKATHKREVQIQRRRKTSWKNVFLDLAEITGVMAAATLAAYVLWLFRLPESNIIMIYILGILLSSYIANKKIYALYSSLISVFAFNFFFTEPYFSLKAYDKGYPTTFVMLFLVGLFTATLTRRLKQQSRESAKKAYRTEILLENSQKLRRCKSKQEVWTQVAGQAGKLLNLSLIIYPMEGSQMSDTPLLFPRKGMDMLHLKTCINRQELAVAQWVAANHHRAGACTHTLPDAKAMYLPIQDARDVKGVMGILLEERRPIQEFEYGLLIAMLNETGVKLQDTFLE